MLERLVILSPFGVNPPRSGGHLAVLEPARQLARAGVDVHLFGMGIRRFEALRHWGSFVRQVEPRLVEERHVSWWNVLDFLRRGRSGLPALDAGPFLTRKASSVLRERCGAAGVLQFECPWLWDFEAPARPCVFVAHNVEALLVEQSGVASPEQLRRAKELEGAAWNEADAVICFTQEDRTGLTERYGARDAAIIPLGVDTERVRPVSADERAAARAELGVRDRYVVLFTGAWHLPNRAAADEMRALAARADDRFLFVVAGSVGPSEERAPQLVVTGPIPDLEQWFRAADCCANPMSTGSGANVKLLDYLAHQHPVVTTPFGARGLDVVDGEHAVITELHGFLDALTALRDDAQRATRIATAGRALVESERSWNVLAHHRRDLYESLL